MRLVNLLLICFIFFSLIFNPSVSADSSYVLPYPSSMPGSIYYKLHLMLEKIYSYWFYGDFGQYKYNLKQSDKYLIEAKTLFEYKQYLLAIAALEKSDTYFKETKHHLQSAKVHGKDIQNNLNEFHQAALAHIEVLQRIKKDVPEDFLWKPEKKSSSQLALHTLLGNSIEIRQENL